MAADNGHCAQRWFHERPFPENCSKEVWSRKWHRCQSWASEDDVRCKVFRHLKSRDEHRGGLEHLDDEGIKELIDSLPIETRTISKRDDEYIRWMQWEEEKNEKRRRDAEDDRRGQNKRQRGGSNKGGISEQQKGEIAEIVASRFGPPSAPRPLGPPPAAGDPAAAPASSSMPLASSTPLASLR
eukprot:8066501-Pyramimonas_sp.AAC.1